VILPRSRFESGIFDKGEEFVEFPDGHELWQKVLWSTPVGDGFVVTLEWLRFTITGV